MRFYFKYFNNDGSDLQLGCSLPERRHFIIIELLFVSRRPLIVGVDETVIIIHKKENGP